MSLNKSLPKPGSHDREHILTSCQQDDHDDDSTKGKWSGPFYFIHAADTQFGMIESFLKKLPDPKWDEEIELSELLVEKCNRLMPKPKFMVICGDLTDAWPQSDKERKRRQIIDFKRIFSKLDPDIPLVCVCGNHDIGNEPTYESLDEYKLDFGDDYFHFITNGVLFIVINSQFYEHRANVEDYAEKQDKWIDEILIKYKGKFKYSILFEHIPWFLKDPNEEDEYFNINRDIRLRWLDKFYQSGISKIMCGHYHRNAGGFYKDMELVVTSAVGASMGEDKSGVRIVKMLDDTIEHQYYELGNIPATIKLQ